MGQTNPSTVFVYQRTRAAGSGGIVLVHGIDETRSTTNMQTAPTKSVDDDGGRKATQG